MKFLLKVLMMLCLGQAGSAWAACTAGSPTINFGSQHIAASAPVGTEFGGTIFTVSYNCDSPVLRTPDGLKSNDVVFQIKPTGMFTALDFVYPTAVQGVGVRLREQATQLFLVRPGRPRVPTAVNSFCWRQMATGNDEGCGKLPPDQCRLGPQGGQCSISFRASLVKLGVVSGGNLNGEYGDIQYYAPGASNGSNLGKMRMSGTVGAARASCTIRDLSVDLGSVNVATLSAEGSSAARRFNVTLRGCEPNQQVALVLSTFTAVGASCDGVIANGASGSATGVGVKVSHVGDDAVCWNREVLYTVRANGIVSVPLQAAIRRTATTPGAGTVVAAMMVQATYR